MLSLCIIIYSEKYAFHWANLNHVLEMFQGLFFTFLLLQKDALEKIIKFWSFTIDWVRSFTFERSIYFEIKKV